MGLFSTVSNKIHQRRLKQAQKEAMKNRKLVLRYNDLQERQEELEKVKTGGLSEKGRAVLAKIKVEKANIRVIRIARAKKVARIVGAIGSSIAKDIHELGGRIEKKQRKVKTKRKSAKKRRSKN